MDGTGGLEAGGRQAVAGRRRQAVRFIVLLGVVSLFADMTYEGARSVTGPFLLSLGAGAGVVGLVAGIGELAGYGARLASGYLADRLRRYWLLTGVGYALNLLAVPLLALAGRWETAAGLVLLERFGKAVRTPPRDVLISYATRQVGRGFGFGLHEALDQIGAVAGPLLVAAVLLAGRGYRPAFAALLLPAALALATLAGARIAYPVPATLEEPARDATGRQGRDREDRDGGGGRSGAPGGSGLGRAFWLYLAFATAAVAGFAHFQLISFHAKARGLIPDAEIPVAFACAMGIDALAALVAGGLYDRVGVGALWALPLGTAPASTLAFGGSPPGAWAGILLWGAVLGVQEAVMRAAVADLAPAAARGSAYGIFNAAFGLAWFLGSAAMGLLYDVSPALVIAFSAVAQAVAAPLLLVLRREIAAGRHPA